MGRKLHRFGAMLRTSTFLGPGDLVGLDASGGVVQQGRACGPLLGLGAGLDQQERAALLQAAVRRRLMGKSSTHPSRPGSIGTALRARAENFQ